MPQVYKHDHILNLWHIFCKFKFYAYELFFPSCKYTVFHIRNVQIIKSNVISPPEIHSFQTCMSVHMHLKILSNYICTRGPNFVHRAVSISLA